MRRGGVKKESFLSLCENINVPVMGYNCQRRPAPDSCVASLICSPGDLRSSQFKFGCGVLYKQAGICCLLWQERVEEAMLIEDLSSFHINHKSHIYMFFKVIAQEWVGKDKWLHAKTVEKCGSAPHPE